ncbi:MAG: carbohydrate ABC transporter permease, partial [Chloroflexi bacterium]|nr:carbohydrate ABC transporter permease [Chloroflexota bacterium]
MRAIDRGTALTHLVLVLGSLVMIFPVLWMVSTSFKPPNEVLSWPPTLLPQ